MTSGLPEAVSSVFITEELARRVATKPDHLREKLALQDLARQMIDSPDQVLARLVDIGIEICGAVSGGISLYEPEPAPGVFRWHHLRGELAKFNGATTPRHFSPCGITLDLSKPTLVQRPERVYTWLQEAQVSLPECLLVPLYIGGHEPIGTLWIVSDAEGHFDLSHSEAMLELAAFAGIALKMAQNERRLKDALEQQETLTREMGHRVKNVFALVDAMVRMSARRATSVKELADSISGRLHALATAHGLVRRTFDSHGTHEFSDFGDLIRTLLNPYDRAGIKTDGPPVNVGSRAGNSVALFFHELATNAAKYGALSADAGTVTVTWQTADGQLAVTWTERGGPAIEGPPQKRGFGTLMAEKTVAAALGGVITYDWQKQGVAVRMTAPLDRLAQ